MPYIPATEATADLALYDPIQIRTELVEALRASFHGPFHVDKYLIQTIKERPFIYYNAEHAERHGYNQRQMREVVRSVYRETTVPHRFFSIGFGGTTTERILWLNEVS